MNISSLSTPCLLLEKKTLDANVRRMLARADETGIAIRPHLKTAKSAAIAELATASKRFGITVSTLLEAEYFAKHGFDDITYAVGIVPSKLDRAAKLMNDGVDLKIIADNEDVVTAIARHGAAFKVLLEIDCGDNRAGIPAESQMLESVASSLLSEATEARLIGVLTHAGHSYGVEDRAAIARIGEEERAAVVDAAGRLTAAGHQISVVSAGSTPTALFMENTDGLTELRAGVYVFFDLDQQSRGVCETDEIALSVLASVIGHNRSAGKLLLDCGGLALSKDLGANAFRPEVGYGVVCDFKTGKPYAGAYVSSVSQEHGHVKVDDEALYEHLPVGSLVRVLPNHACMTAAAYDRYFVVDSGNVIAEWDRVNGW